MTNEIDSHVFNTQKTDYEKPKLILGQNTGLFDTVNKQYPKIWKRYKSMKSLDWDENEFDYSSCMRDFEKCSKSTYDIMIKTLAWQWEADSVASKSIAPVLAPFITSNELWAAWQRISDNEVIHSATYSEIVRNSFKNPNEVLDEVLKIEQSLTRLSGVSEVFAKAYRTSHLYALDMVENNQETYNDVMMMIVALLILERIQFMASFAVTFAICDSGMFMPIGKAVQKIAQDELEEHVALDKEVLRVEMGTARGKIFFKQKEKEIQKLIDDVLYSEFEWVDYLFSEGRELVGMNAEYLKRWTAFCAKDVYNFFSLQAPITLPKSNPAKFMENWLNIGKTQPAPQEESVGQYRMGILRRDDESSEFDVDF